MIGLLSILLEVLAAWIFLAQLSSSLLSSSDSVQVQVGQGWLKFQTSQPTRQPYVCSSISPSPNHSFHPNFNNLQSNFMLKPNLLKMPTKFHWWILSTQTGQLCSTIFVIIVIIIIQIENIFINNQELHFYHI